MRLRFTGVCAVSDARQQENRDYSHRLGLPEIGTRSVAPSLAVAGGGPALADHLDALRAWDGEIWAINGTYAYLRRQGVDCTFFRIDPGVPPAFILEERIERAVLGDICDPSMFAVCAEQGSDVEIARIGGDGGSSHGTSAACTAPILAAHRGHREVVLFGCEGSFAASTHVDRDDTPDVSRLWGECGGVEYVTSPQMLMQTEWLSEMARALPGFVKVRGGGLLAAMVEHGVFDVTAATQNIHDQIKEQAA